MKRPLVLLCAAAAALFAASTAEAGRVSWSVGVNVPPVATYVAGGPAWYPAVRYAPPVVYASAPVYVDPYVDVYDVAPYGVYAPVYHRRPHYWVAPPARFERGWNRHDRWHHDGGHRR
jgi:hypothetical protein